jgi:hypothetical protein
MSASYALQALSASFANTATSASFVSTASFATSASIAATASFFSGSVVSASYALTASFALNAGGGGGASFPFTGSAIISGSLIVTGSAFGNVISASVSSLTASLDFNVANFYTCVVTASTFFNVTGLNPGETTNVLLTVAQNSASPSPTASFSSNVKQVSGSRYIPTSGSGANDLLSFITFDGTNVFLLSAQKFV